MTTFHSRASRRAFLRQAAAFAGYGAAAPLALNLAALGSASAQTAGGGYKALVCLFLFGGNDAYNMLLPTDAASWANYQSVRNQAPDPIALRAPGTPPDAGAAAGSPARLGGVLPLDPIDAQGRSVALHPLMAGARDLFAAGRLAVVSNVGPLIRPTSKAEYRTASFPKPASLFSHNDQQSTWQSGAAEGATVGWGGRMGDLLMSANTRPLFTSVSASGNAVWLAGRQVLQYQVSTAGAIRIGGAGASTLFGSATALERMRNVMRNARTGDLLARDHAAVVGRSIDAEQLVSASLPPANQAPYGTAGLASGQADPLLQYDHPLTGARANNSLAAQLQVVARMIGARASLGAQRQVFFVSLGGFDTHDTQNRSHADLMARLAHALAYFDGVLGGMGLREQVTLFTASDFGRTFTSNGDGTDHGWGAHHLVMGGAVRGRNLYGRLPALGLADGRNDFTSPDQIGNGSLLPSTSVDQYAATLGRWFGLADTQLLDVFPHLAHFSQRDLGFMQA
jgi:uncharacterized protein (DUF1501 family)